MAGEVSGLYRRRAVAQIAGRGHDSHAKRRPDGQRDHVLLEVFPEADSCIVAASHDIGHRALHAHLHLDARVEAHEGGEHRPQYGACGVFARRDPHRSDRGPDRLGQRLDLLIEPGQCRRQGGQQSLASGSRGNTARRTREEAEAEFALQPLHCLAQSRLRDPKPPRSLRETAVSSDRCTTYW